MDTWLISDTHFNHTNILKFEDSEGALIRGQFGSVAEMNEHMIDCWNSVVKPGDRVYHLGDVFIGDLEGFKKLWPRLCGSKRLIVGNHDNIKFLSSGGFFKKVLMWRILPEFKIMLTHVPVNPNNLKIFYSDDEDSCGKFTNVHGHIHQNPSPAGPYFNVSVEAINYTPVNLEELSNRLTGNL